MSRGKTWSSNIARPTAAPSASRSSRRSWFACEFDLIVARGTPAILAAKNASSTIPVVMAAAAEPLMFVASLARPGGNVTGLSSFTNVLAAKRVEILRDAIPGIARIAALLTMSNPVVVPQWQEIETAARTLRYRAAAARRA